jgi:NADH dehydrogenase
VSRRLFLTGATGFLGRRLLARLRQRDVEVTCLVRRAGPGEEGRVRWVLGDLRRPEPWLAELQGTHTVVHVAGVTGTAPEREHQAVNAEATAILARGAAAAGARRFVFVSTIAVKFADRSRYPYARAKEAGEAAVRASGTPWLIVRPTIVLGPDAPVLAGLRRLARLPVLPLFGGGRARVQPVHVGDLAELLDRILQDEGLSGEVVEAGGPEVVTLADLLRELRRLEGKPPRALSLPIGPLAALLWWLERAGLRLPVTAGQLATFVEDGIAKPHSWVASRHLLQTPLAEMLR